MNDPLSLLSFVIGIAGIIASFIFYVRSKEQSNPVWRTAKIPLIGGNSALLPADVEVMYRGEKVQSLSKSYVAFWNAGRKTIPGGDIASADPIRFTSNDSNVRILDARPIRVTREVNQASVQYNENEMRLKFDFLDSRDGVTIEIIHTGIDKRFECDGTIKGIPRGIRQVGTPNRPLKFRSKISDNARRANDLAPGDLLDSSIGLNTVTQVILLVGTLFLGAIAIFSLFFFTIPTAAELREHPPSYQQYLEAMRIYPANVSNSGTEKAFGIYAATGAVVMFIILIGLIIKSWKFRLPARLALTEADVSDRS